MPIVSRRGWLAGSLAATGLSAAGLSSKGAASARGPSSNALPDAAPANAIPIDQRRWPIWPGLPPGGSSVTVEEREVLRRPGADPEDTAWVHVRTPTITHFAPPASAANGAAILIIPGGGYRRVGIGLGTLAIARHFARLGFSAYMLIYRLPADGWEAGPDAPLQDAQRALRIVHSRAQADGFSPERIGVFGGSAGGHLAARLLCRPDLHTYTACDAIDAQPLTARAGCLLYPVVATNGPYAHGGSRGKLVGSDASEQQAAPYAADVNISPATPPIFLAHAMDDRAVPWQNSTLMMQALDNAGVTVAARFYEEGGHGFDLAGPARGWTREFLEFAARTGLPQQAD